MSHTTTPVGMIINFSAALYRRRGARAGSSETAIFVFPSKTPAACTIGRPLSLTVSPIAGFSFQLCGLRKRYAHWHPALPSNMYPVRVVPAMQAWPRRHPRWVTVAADAIHVVAGHAPHPALRATLASSIRISRAMARSTLSEVLLPWTICHTNCGLTPSCLATVRCSPR